MAVKRRLSGYSGMRIDIPHLRSIESAVSFDFDSLLRGMVTGADTPYILKGFNVRIPNAAISASNLQVDVSDSAILHSTASESGTIFTVPAGTQADQLSASNSKVVGSFQYGVANYVSLALIRTTDTDTTDQTAGWSESQKSEFQRTVPIGRTMDYQYIINTSGFSTNLPLYIVGVTSTGAVEYITKSQPGLYRLGRGGTVPDPYASFEFGNLSNPQDTTNPRREWVNENPTITPNPVSIVPGDEENAFSYGDWSITTLKEWMDAIMTRIKEVTGSAYWYTDSNLGGDPINIADLWWDSVGNVLTGNGSISYNMIMEMTGLTSGALQTNFNDSTILSGDSYVVGKDSFNKANLQAFYSTQLIINSLIRDSFIYDETLYNRRIFRPSLALFELNDDTFSGDRVALLKRLSGTPSGSSKTVTAWSVSGQVLSCTATAHGFEVGDYVKLTNFNSSTGEYLPNDVHLVKNVPDANTFETTPNLAPTGTAVIGGTEVAQLDSGEKHPYLPRNVITEWEYTGTSITVTAPNHALSTGDDIVVMGLTATTNAPNGRHLSVTVNLDNTISFTAPAAPTGTASVTANSFVMPDSYSFLLTTSNIEPTAYNKDDVTATAWSDTQLTYVLGADTMPAQGAGSGPITLDGVVAVTTVANPSKVLYIENLGSPDYSLKVTTATPHSFSNQYDINHTIYGDTSISPYIRTYEHMNLIKGSHAPKTITSISQSGTADVTVVCSSHGYSVSDIVIVSGNSEASFNGTWTITNVVDSDTFQFQIAIATANGLGGMATAVDDISTIVGNGTTTTVTSSATHGFYSGNTIRVSGTVNFDGDYTITVIDSTTFTFASTTVASESIGTISNLCQFLLIPVPPQGTAIVPPPFQYDNLTGADSTFARYPDNPYPGPIQWTDDMYVKAIIGDKWFRIPQTATAEGTPVANRFNVGGLTGTAFLQDGEVCYIDLRRNEEVSSGATYYTTGGADVVGSTPPIDSEGDPLEAGDFVKWEGETENKWFRIAGTLGAPILSNNFSLVGDNGQPPSTSQRPAVSGAMLFCKSTYGTVTVKPHWQVASSPNVYWIAVRRDNGSLKSRVYLKALELEAGEVREINDNEPTNLLVYTGAGTEAAINPNYTVIDQIGSYKATKTVTIGSNPEDIDTFTKTLTITDPPILGFQADDKIVFDIGGVPYTYTIEIVHTSLTVTVNDDISVLSTGQTGTYYQTNQVIEDTDNLTLGMRKIDREEGKINTALERPVYDESIYPQLINLTKGAGDEIRSGNYIYQGSASSPTALSWVLHGTDNVNEKIEDITKAMPGGVMGANSILVHHISGTWTDGDSVSQQNLTLTGTTINNPGDPAFTSPELPSGLTFVLPPNKRTQLVGSGYATWPAMATYKASLSDSLKGEELMVIINDTIREANLDYEETFGGPKGMISLLTDQPPNSRLRFRIMPAYGSALVKLAGTVTLQTAYDGGNIISTIAGLPVDIRTGDFATSGTGLALKGSMEINGVGSTPDVGIFGPRDPIDIDQAFVVGKESNKPKEVWTGLNAIKKHTGYTGSGWINTTATGASTGSASFVLNDTAISVPDNHVARIKMTAVARETGSNNGGASFSIEGTFYRSGGALQAAGSPTTTHLGSYGDGNQYAVSFGLSGNDVVLVVFGTAGSTIQWVTGIDYQMVSDSV